MEKEHQVPIWFFIGSILAIYGVLILATGLYHLISPPEHQVVLYNLHADIWWGAFMVIVGVFYVVKFRPTADTASANADTQKGLKPPGR
jgi:uncharacterized membrane protein HdeD (DUF308 family)